MSEPDHNHAVEIVEQRVPMAPPPPPTVHPLVHAAMASKDIDVVKLEKLLAVQREFEAGEAKKAFTSALAGLKRDLPAVIRKDAEVDYGSGASRTHFKHATLANVMDGVNEPLARHGFSLSWHPATPNGQVQVTCRLTHAGGHREEVTLTAPPDAKGGKGAAQAIASTITLLERYTALALLGIATRDMKEPTGEDAAPADAGAVVDPALNLRAAGWLKNQRGVAVAEAEALLGRRVPEWTAADLEKIKAKWAQAAPAAAQPAPSPATTEPPHRGPAVEPDGPPAGPSAATKKRLCDVVAKLHGKGADPAEETNAILGAPGVRVLEDLDEQQALEAIRRFDIELREMIDEGLGQ